MSERDSLSALEADLNIIAIGEGGGRRTKEDERHPVHCGFDVKESIWMSVFNTVLNVVVSIVFLYRPYLFCVVQDFFTDEHRQERKRNFFQNKKIRIMEKKEQIQTKFHWMMLALEPVRRWYGSA